MYIYIYIITHIPLYYHPTKNPTNLLGSLLSSGSLQVPDVHMAVFLGLIAAWSIGVFRSHNRGVTRLYDRDILYTSCIYIYTSCIYIYVYIYIHIVSYYVYIMHIYIHIIHTIIVVRRITVYIYNIPVSVELVDGLWASRSQLISGEWQHHGSTELIILSIKMRPKVDRKP